jgi:hypothetical protein
LLRLCGVFRAPLVNILSLLHEPEVGIIAAEAVEM